MHKESVLYLKAVLQRVSFAEVLIEGKSQGSFAKGLVILFGVGSASAPVEELSEPQLEIIVKDYSESLNKLADKILSLRIFPDSEGKLNHSVVQVQGGIYIVSQFTLFADCKKGNRPSFTEAARPVIAQKIYQKFVELIREKNPELPLHTGIFAANMQVHLCNDGPVTIIVEADKKGII